MSLRKLIGFLGFCLLLIAGIAAFVGGCESAAESVEEAVECGQICEAFEDCRGDEFDVSACVDRCEDLDEGEVQVAEDCDDCLDRESVDCPDEEPCREACRAIGAP